MGIGGSEGPQPDPQPSSGRKVGAALVLSARSPMSPSLWPGWIPRPCGHQGQAEVDTTRPYTHVHRLTLKHSTCPPNMRGQDLRAPGPPHNQLGQVCKGGWCHLPKLSAPPPPPEPVGHCPFPRCPPCLPCPVPGDFSVRGRTRVFTTQRTVPAGSRTALALVSAAPLLRASLEQGQGPKRNLTWSCLGVGSQSAEG